MLGGKSLGAGNGGDIALRLERMAWSAERPQILLHILAADRERDMVIEVEALDPDRLPADLADAAEALENA